MQSPYQQFLKDMSGKMTLDFFITRENQKLSQRVQFNDEEFELLVEFLEDMFPPEKEGDTFTFKVEADCDYELKVIENEQHPSTP